MIPKIEFKVCGQGNNPQVYGECEKFIKEWAKILRIQDWKIGLGFLSGIETHNAMGSDEYNAICERTTVNKTAFISINAESSQINDDLEKHLYTNFFTLFLMNGRQLLNSQLKTNMLSNN